MSITNQPSTELVQNLLGVLAHADHKVHDEVVKTTAVYQEYVVETQQVISSQAAKIAHLEARIIQLEAKSQQQSTAYNAQLTAQTSHFQSQKKSMEDSHEQQLKVIYSKLLGMEQTRCSMIHNIPYLRNPFVMSPLISLIDGLNLQITEACNLTDRKL